MANTSGICNSFKFEVLTGIHALGPGTGVPARTVSTADVVKCALFFAAGSLTPSTVTAYGVAPANANEVTANGSYSAGGSVVTQANAPLLYTNTGTWNPSANLSWTGVTWAAFDCALFYNSSQANKSIELCNFGSQSIVAGTFTLTMPTAGAATSMIQLT